MPKPRPLNARLALTQQLESRIRSRARIAAMTELKNRHYEEYTVLYQKKKVELLELAVEELTAPDDSDDTGVR